MNFDFKKITDLLNPEQAALEVATKDISLSFENPSKGNLDDVLASGINQEKLARHLLATKRGRLVAEQIEKFDPTKVDMHQLALALTQAPSTNDHGLGKYVLDKIDTYGNLDAEPIVKYMVDSGIQLYDLFEKVGDERRLAKLRHLSFDLLKDLCEKSAKGGEGVHQLIFSCLKAFDLQPQNIVELIKLLMQLQDDRSVISSDIKYPLLRGIGSLGERFSKNESVLQALRNVGVTQAEIDQFIPEGQLESSVSH